MGEGQIGSELVCVTYIRANAQALWNALIDPGLIPLYWNGANQCSSWKVGEPWELQLPDGRVADSGEVLVCDKPHRLSVSWRNDFVPDLTDEGHSRCTWTLEPIGDVVKLTIVHEIDVAESRFIEAAGRSWPAILAGLKTLLETGKPLEMSEHWPSKRLRAENP